MIKNKNILEINQDKYVKCNTLQKRYLKYVNRNTNRMQKIFSIRNTPKEVKQKVQIEAGSHTYVESTQQHKKVSKKKKKIYERLHEKEMSNATLLKDIYSMYKGPQAVRTCD